MHRDICLTNVNGISYWIDEFINELEEIKKIMSGTSKEIEDLFIDAWESRAKWLKGEVGSEKSLTDDLPKTGEAMMSLLMGDSLAKRAGEKIGQSDDNQTKYPTKIPKKLLICSNILSPFISLFLKQSS